MLASWTADRKLHPHRLRGQHNSLKSLCLHSSQRSSASPNDDPKLLAFVVFMEVGSD